MGNGSKSITCGLKYTILLHHLLHLDILCSDGCNLFEQELSWIFLDYNLFEALFVKLKNGENLYIIHSLHFGIRRNSMFPLRADACESQFVRARELLGKVGASHHCQRFVRFVVHFTTNSLKSGPVQPVHKIIQH